MDTVYVVWKNCNEIEVFVNKVPKDSFKSFIEGLYGGSNVEIIGVFGNLIE